MWWGDFTGTLELEGGVIHTFPFTVKPSCLKITCVILITGGTAKLVPPYTRGRVSFSLSRGPMRKPGASLYTRERLSLSFFLSSSSI
jgi:hypothetical protein